VLHWLHAIAQCNNLFLIILCSTILNYIYHLCALDVVASGINDIIVQTLTSGSRGSGSSAGSIPVGFAASGSVAGFACGSVGVGSVVDVWSLALLLSAIIAGF
jgi:hypothetical protein